MLGSGMIIAGFPLVIGVGQQARQERSGTPLAMLAYAVLVGVGGFLAAGIFGYV